MYGLWMFCVSLWFGVGQEVHYDCFFLFNIVAWWSSCWLMRYVYVLVCLNPVFVSLVFGCLEFEGESTSKRWIEELVVVETEVS